MKSRWDSVIQPVTSLHYVFSLFPLSLTFLLSDLHVRDGRPFCTLIHENQTDEQIDGPEYLTHSIEAGELFGTVESLFDASTKVFTGFIAQGLAAAMIVGKQKDVLDG